jgi:hypothetical protein
MEYIEFRLRVPYGKWTCADGREVIFNREYWPILECRPGEKVKPANPNEWIHWVTQDWFFEDINAPWYRRRPKTAARTLERINQLLAEWGYPPLPKPARPKPYSGNLKENDRLPDRPDRINPYKTKNVV